MIPFRVTAELAAEVGFDFCAAVSLDRPIDITETQRRVQAGYLADMKWFERSLEKRSDLRRWMPDVRSLITVGLSYFCENPPRELWDNPARGRIARYAWGPDYHKILTNGLRKMAAGLQQLVEHPLPWRACVDSGPVFERHFAAAGQAGFITRNTMFVHAQYGAYVVLGELLVSVPLEPSPPAPHLPADPCPSCRACFAACPTHALVADYTLDARRCLAYLTVEHRTAIPAEFRRPMGRWIFGCDECLQPCSYALRALPSAGGLKYWKFDPDTSAPPLFEVLRWTERDFLERYAGTAVERIGWRRFLRNALIASGNSGEKSLADLLTLHARSSDDLLSEHAKWALARLAQAPNPA